MMIAVMVDGVAVAVAEAMTAAVPLAVPAPLARIVAPMAPPATVEFARWAGEAVAPTPQNAPKGWPARIIVERAVAICSAPTIGFGIRLMTKRRTSLSSVQLHVKDNNNYFMFRKGW